MCGLRQFLDPIVLIQVHCYFWSTTTSKPINCAFEQRLLQSAELPPVNLGEKWPDLPTGRSCFGRQSLPSWGLCGTRWWGAVWRMGSLEDFGGIPGSYHDPIDPLETVASMAEFFYWSIFSWCRKHPSPHLNTMICFILFHREVPLRLLQLSMVHNFLLGLQWPNRTSPQMVVDFRKFLQDDSNWFQCAPTRKAIGS